MYDPVSVESSIFVNGVNSYPLNPSKLLVGSRLPMPEV